VPADGSKDGYPTFTDNMRITHFCVPRRFRYGMGVPGLRESKKLATRQALSWAAMRLAVERGLANVLVEDIAAAAGVSPRTYNNYFASKEAAICGIIADRAELIRAALAARPADEPLADAVLAAVMAPYDLPNDPDRDWVARTRVVLAEPALRGEFLKAMIAMEQALVEGIAARLGTDVGLFPRVVAASAVGATRVGIDHWLFGGTTEPFTTVVAAAVRIALPSTVE
jgi:AcrR family transcriptional regulator